jgi:hypothetical protein
MSSPPARLIAVAASLSALAVPASAGAQKAVMSNQQCERSLSQVETAPEEVMTRGALHLCGARGAEALARLVRQAAHRTDDAYWTTLFWATETPLQPVLDAAVDLARDRTAPVSNRIRGLVLLAHQVYGEDVHLMTPGGHFDSLTTADDCRFAASGDGGPLKGQVSVLRQVAKSLSDDRTEPHPLRLAALCIVRHDRPSYQLAEDPGRIRISVACGSDYDIRNDLDHQIILRFDVRGTAAGGNLVVPPHRKIRFDTFAPGTARFFTGDELIAAVPSSPKRCTTEP